MLGLATCGGAALIALTILPLYATGHYELVATRGLGGAPLSTGTIAALLAISLAFGALHLFNAGVAPMTLLSVSLLGMLWTAIFVLTRNLWACTLHHAAWNFALFSTGLPLSGSADWRALAPLESQSRGPDLWTGGAFGPEDSILSVGIVALSVVAVLALARKRGRIEPRPAR